MTTETAVLVTIAAAVFIFAGGMGIGYLLGLHSALNILESEDEES